MKMKLQTWLRYATIVTIFVLLVLRISDYVQILETWGFLPVDVIYIAATPLIAFIQYWTITKWTSLAGEKPGILMYVAIIVPLIIFIGWPAYYLFKFFFEIPSRTEDFLDIWVDTTITVGLLIASQASMNVLLKSDTE